ILPKPMLISLMSMSLVQLPLRVKRRLRPIYQRSAELLEEQPDLPLAEALDATALVNADLTHDLLTRHFPYLGQGLQQVRHSHPAHDLVVRVFEDLLEANLALLELFAHFRPLAPHLLRLLKRSPLLVRSQVGQRHLRSPP